MIAIKGFKVWAINDCDWVWGTTFAGAVDAYISQCGVPLAELFDYNDGEINSSECEMSDEAMDKFKIRDEDSEEKATFREELIRRVDAGEDVGFFASTEY